MLNTPLLDQIDRSKYVLIVDDSKANRLLLGFNLRELGFHNQLFAENGADALNQFRANRHVISFVITDHKMPVMSGSELFWNLKMEDPNVLVILCSGSPEWDEIGPMLRDGLKKFVEKPLSQKKLVSALETAFS